MAGQDLRANPGVNPWLKGVSVLAGIFMAILDSTVVNVSLPFIAGNLSATIEEATWVLTGNRETCIGVILAQRHLQSK